MNANLINHIAATIRRVDGSHTMGAGQLAEAIVNDLRGLRFSTDQPTVDNAVDALVNEGWEETHEGPQGVGTLSREDLADIARVVFRSVTESGS